MKKFAILIFVFIAIVACKNNTKTDNETVIEEEKAEIETTVKPTLETGCYEYNNDGNNIKMEITEINEKVIGNLNIAYAEKDTNQGKFVGNIDGDKLIGIYTFNAEGKESSRELAFMIKDNQLIEGYGDLNEDGTKFKDVKTIQYVSTMPLTKVDCTK